MSKSDFGIMLGALVFGFWLVVAPVLAQLPDPTRPPGAAELAAWRGQPGAQDATWRLESVLVSPQRRVAVINGRRVTEGDTVDGARIGAIEATHALIEVEGQTRRLNMKRHGIEGRELP